MKTLPLLMSLLLSVAPAHATEGATPLRDRLQARHEAIARAFLAEDVEALARHYDGDAMLMPEHGTARSGAGAIADYYRQWFAAADASAFQRTPYEVLDLGDHAIETGSFTQTFTRTGAAPYEYVGKYMVLWDLRGDAPRIVSELWGANAPFDRAALPAIPPAPPVTAQPFENDPQVAREIRARNALIDTLVTERRGDEHADLFLPDAIYLTYYTPPLVGIAPIRAYFLEHEQPGELTIEALELDAARIHPLAGGELQLEEGFYRVDWQAGGDRGTVTGKSLNLWKRSADGVWMLYRQAVNHD
ncbi:nuclear transport factor 2 family protein [Pseudoxanthomonas putridarboris]|uniref:Nuclear transport factor 2 family protein n=1 Tax=Pseudoxanthomonas putridarboris TaxID=752605 RepID=A0ABU9J0Y3_9GAMM